MEEPTTFTLTPSSSSRSCYTSLLLERHLKSLDSNHLRAQVEVPAGANEDEWLAVTTIDTFNELTLLAGALADICTEKTCPCMCAGPYSFAWCDGEEFKEPTQMSAPRYMEHLLTWVEMQLADESFLPIMAGMPFPQSYHATMRVIYKRLFRIYAHIFHSHFNDLVAGDADAHFNYSFMRFMYFVEELDLITKKDLDPLKDLIACH